MNVLILLHLGCTYSFIASRRAVIPRTRQTFRWVIVEDVFLAFSIYNFEAKTIFLNFTKSILKCINKIEYKHY